MRLADSSLLPPVHFEQVGGGFGGCVLLCDEADVLRRPTRKTIRDFLSAFFTITQETNILLILLRTCYMYIFRPTFVDGGISNNVSPSFEFEKKQQSTEAPSVNKLFSLTAICVMAKFVV